MLKNILKKLGREVEEPEDLDTGYDSGYYGGQSVDDDGAAAPARPASRGYEEPDYRSGREEYVPPRTTGDSDRRQSAGGYYEEEPYASRGERSYGRSAATTVPVNKGTLYFKPDFYSDKRDEMVTGLSEGHVVMVSVNNMSSEDRMRLVDYLMGAVCALKGQVAYRNGILGLTPKGVELDEADYEILEDEESEEYGDEAYAEEEVFDEEYDYSDYEGDEE